MADSQTINLVDSRHPGYLSGMTDWAQVAIDLRRRRRVPRSRTWSSSPTREDQLEFNARKAMTPIPKFAGAAINDIRNAIYQRMRDITRKGGSKAYQDAVNGNNLGVDRRGSTMNAFLGVKVLTELLVMGRVGVFVDAPLVPAGATLADIGGVAPYLYKYDIEDILSLDLLEARRPVRVPGDPAARHGDAVRPGVLPADAAGAALPLSVDQPGHRQGQLAVLRPRGQPVDQYGQPGGEIELELDRIPFVMLDIGDSLIKDVCQHQIALLNLGSSDVNYALRSNFPFYVEQKDLRAVGAHLKHAATADGTATTGGQARPRRTSRSARPTAGPTTRG